MAKSDLGDLVGIVALHALLQRPDVHPNDAVTAASKVEVLWREKHPDISEEAMPE